jgi:hypothetical protein
MDSGFSPLMDHVAQAQGRPWTQDTGSRVGCPIRKSLDQSSFAAPQGLSQRTTSFIASQRQGIHRMPLRHLIALMIDVRHSRDRTRISARALGRTQAIRKTCPWISPRTYLLAKWIRLTRPAGPLLAAGLIFLPAGSIPSLRFQSRSDAARPIHSLTSRMPQGQLGRAQKRNEGGVSPVTTPSQGGAA